MDLLDRELCSKATAKSKIEFEKGNVKGSSNKVRTLIRGPEQLDKKYEYNKTRRKTTCWNCIAACLGSMLVNAFSRALVAGFALHLDRLSVLFFQEINLKKIRYYKIDI